MVATTPDISEVVRSIVLELSGKIRVAQLILFGSYAGGQPRRWSDIDIAVISPDFAGMPLWRRQEMLAESLPNSDARLSPIGYSPDDLLKPTLFLKEILATGRVVYEAGE